MSEQMSAEERGRLGAAKRWGKKAEAENDKPVYRVTEQCHHHDKIYEPDELLEFEGHPEYYMEPANEAAQAMYEKHPPKPFLDPINAMTRLPTDAKAA